MKVSVNEKAVSSELSAQDTLEDLIDELRRSGAIRPDEVVAGLTVDRRPMRSVDMEEAGTTRLDTISQVAIETDDVAGYGRRILQDAAGMATVLSEAGPRVATLLRNGEIEKANDQFFNLLQVLQHLLACVDTVEGACISDSANADTRRLTMALLSASLDTVVKCQENKDWDTMAERIDEHLVPAFNGVLNLINSMHRQA
mgnify:CR=1 FL=1